MKFFLPVTLSFLTLACAAPKPGTASHQRLLEDQARENFYAMKKAEQQSRPASAVAVRAEPAAEPQLRTIASVKPTPAPKRASLFASARPVKTRRNEDTVYIFDMPRISEPTSARYRNYKRQYAQALGKQPEDLTPKELEWARKRYRD